MAYYQGQNNTAKGARVPGKKVGKLPRFNKSARGAHNACSSQRPWEGGVLKSISKKNNKNWIRRKRERGGEDNAKKNPANSEPGR